MRASEDEAKLDPAVTFIVAENGSGKATRIKALYVAAERGGWSSWLR